MFWAWPLLKSLEEVVISSIIGMFIVSSLISLTVSNHPVTEEEAIEISKRSDLVREMFTHSLRSNTLGAEYYNFSHIQQRRAWNRDHGEGSWEFRVPEGHGAWEVGWRFLEEGGRYYAISTVIVAETGKIIHELMRVRYG